MKPEQYAAYQRGLSQGPFIDIADLDTGDHTLVVGYTIERNDFHAYVMDDEIHVVVHDQGYVINHNWGATIQAELLRPSKRAYPDATNETFAHLMRAAGKPITFLGRFDWGSDSVRERAAMDGFKDKTHLNLRHH